MRLLPLISSLSSLICVVRCAAPVLLKSESFRMQLDMGGGGGGGRKGDSTSGNAGSGGGGGGGPPVMDLFYVVNTFDQPIFLKNSTGHLIPSTAMLGQTKASDGKYVMTIPNAAVYGYGNALINCGGTFFPPWSGNVPIQETLVLPASSSPLSTFIMSMSGIVLNETINPNQHVVVSAVSDPSYTNEIIASACKIHYMDSAKLTAANVSAEISKAHFLASADGTVVGTSTPVSIPLPKTEFPCTLTAMSDLIQLFNQIIDYAQTVTRVEDFGMIENLMMGLQARPVFASCKNLAVSFFNTSMQPTSVATNKYFCPFEYESLQWQMDPCCNWNLGQYQCCLPKTQTIYVPLISNIITSNVNAKCQSSGQVVSLMYDFSDVMNKASLEKDFDMGSVWTTYGDFFQKCSKKVFQQECTADSQCYSGKCDSNSQKCAVTWGEEYKPLVNCYLDLMPTDLSFELKSIWKLPAIYPNASVEAQIFQNEFKSRLFSVDCVGPSSWQYRSQEKWEQNNEGYYERTIIPGNQTGCISEKKCNYQQWKTYNSEAECTAGRPNFCAACYGGWCNEVTQYPQCSSWSLRTQSDCIGNGGYWTDWNSCQYDVVSIEECYKNTTCDGVGSYENCYSDQCVKYNVTDPNNCTWQSVQQWVEYNATSKTCRIPWTDKATCESKGFTHYYGKYFHDGQFYTQSRCEVGMCDNPYLYGQQSKKEDCEASQYCNRGCEECQGGTSCQYPEAGDFSSCSAVSGSWSNNVCTLSFYEEATCKLNNGTFFSCGDFSNNKTGCAAGRPGLGQCWWTEWGKCKNKAACESRGECEDWEFWSQCDYSGNCEPGVCFRRTPPGNNTYCDWANGENWARGGCILTSITTKSQCLTEGYEWKKRAKSKEECYAHGMGCDEEDQWQATPKNSTECSKCKGKQVPLYRWNGGVWKNGTMIPLYWKAKAFETVNEWKETLDYTKLNMAIHGAISSIATRQYINSMNKKYSAIMSFLKTVSCACGSQSRGDCFSAIQSTTIATCRADPGVQSSCEGVVVSNNTFGTNSSATVQVDIVSGSSFVDASSTNSTGKATLADVASFAVIKSGNNVVGQLVGNGKSFSVSANIVNSLSICLDVNPSIPQANADFPVPDLVQLNGNQLSAPLNLTVTVLGTQLCADINKAGTYFPVIRKSAFNVGGGSTDAATSNTKTTTDSQGTSTQAGQSQGTTQTTNSVDQKTTTTTGKGPTKLPGSSSRNSFIGYMIIVASLLPLILA